MYSRTSLSGRRRPPFTSDTGLRASSQKLAGFSSESWSQHVSPWQTQSVLFVPDRLSPCGLRLISGQPCPHNETLARSLVLFFKIASICKRKWYLPYTVDKRVPHHRAGHSGLVHPGTASGLVLRWLCSHITAAGSVAKGGHSTLGWAIRTV